MHWRWLCAMILSVAGMTPAGLRGEVSDFSASDVGRWTLSKGAAVDTTKDRSGGAGGSLRVPPGAQATWKLRDADGAGRVDMWVFDDQTKAENPKNRHAGPRWGLQQADGRVLVMGVLYAPYLSGDQAYAASDSDGKAWLASVQYSGLKRSPGWHQWSFDFDPDKGLSVKLDGKPARLDWNATQLRGFTGVAIFGDDGDPSPQTVWVDDVNVTLGGPVKAQPKPPAPPPSILPEKDPAPEKEYPLVEAVRGQHPRLMFSASELARIQKNAEGPSKVFYDQLVAYSKACVPPTNTKYTSDATEAQRQGMWRLPTAALHYRLTRDPKSLENAIGILKHFLAQDCWEVGDERDCGMTAANILAGAALAYDWLYQDLPADLRTTLRQRLFKQARLMYIGGHQMKVGRTHFWQNDPHNNHRWHHDAGLTLAVLAIADEEPESKWLLAKTVEELDFLHKWLPPEGTSHESSSYQIFGLPYIVFAADAADRCLGTHYMDNPYYKTVPLFRLSTLTPGMKDALHYGDSSGLGAYNNALFRCTAVSRNADQQAGLLELLKASPKAFEFGWYSLIWFDPTVTGGSVEKLPKSVYFSDMGMRIVRDRWDDSGVALMFKCSPPGGATLNAFRNANNLQYINVGHDDPDANMFVLYAKGQYIADDDRYAAVKYTSSHNVLLVNGKGQKIEGKAWTQPIPKVDMTTLAFVTATKDAGDVVITQGEAADAYTGLSRFRRTAAWVRGSYVLILDEIAAKEESDIAWLLQGPKVSIADAAGGKFDLGPCLVRIASDRALAAEVVASTAKNHEESLGYQQLQLKAKTKQWRLATVFDPWGRGVELKLNASAGGPAQVQVTVAGQTDAWDWQAAVQLKQASEVKVKRADGSSAGLMP